MTNDRASNKQKNKNYSLCEQINLIEHTGIQYYVKYTPIEQSSSSMTTALFIYRYCQYQSSWLTGHHATSCCTCQGVVDNSRNTHTHTHTHKHAHLVHNCFILVTLFLIICFSVQAANHCISGHIWTNNFKIFPTCFL